MTDPTVEFPHDDEPAETFSPRFYERDGSPSTSQDAEAAWDDRGVAWTAIRTKSGSRAVVSTVFLGLDHAIDPALIGPLLFETAVFDPHGIVFRTRSRSEDAARTAHASALIDLVAAIETSTPDDPFPTSPVRNTPSAYLAADPSENEGTTDDRPDPPEPDDPTGEPPADEPAGDDGLAGDGPAAAPPASDEEP